MKKLFFVAATLFLVLAVQAGEKSRGKVYLSVDMEGIWGIVHSDQTSAESSEYGPARKWMVEDVNAVIAGLLEAGATEIVVNDAHGSMRNILASDLNPKASLISGSPKPLTMMQGIDGSFEACLLIGYHARAGTAWATLDHTISSSTVHAIRINGQEMPELGINGAIAGFFDVPVIMVSGDKEVCNQARSLLGQEVVTVAVKEAIGRHAAKLMPLGEARRMLQEGAKEAMLKRAAVKVFKLTPPFKFEVEFMNSGQVDILELIPQVKRTDARTVAFTSNDYLEGFKLMRALIVLASK
jgi:D-amino peptidase